MQRTNKRSGVRGFVILVAIVVISGAFLWSQGDLINPMQSTAMLISMSSGEAGFAMVSEDAPAARSAETTTVTAENTAVTETSTSESASAETAVETSTSETVAATTGTMTLDEFTTELAANGVNVEAVSATMSEGGRSLENLLTVVNSGRVTVADLATRLKGETNTEITPASEEGISTQLLDLRWDELGSVAYDLWFMLAITAVVIILARPAGWLVNRIKRAQATA
jgi:hypothetical protein